MIPVAFYVLRERTRPSEQEAESFFASCVLQCEGVDLTSGGQLVCYIANVMRPSDDLGKDFEEYIRLQGGLPGQAKGIQMAILRGADRRPTRANLPRPCLRNAGSESQSSASPAVGPGIPGAR